MKREINIPDDLEKKINDLLDISGKTLDSIVVNYLKNVIKTMSEVLEDYLLE